MTNRVTLVLKRPGLTDNIGKAVDAGLVRLGRALGGLHRGRQAHHADLRYRRRHLGVTHHDGLQVTCLRRAVVKAEVLPSVSLWNAYNVFKPDTVHIGMSSALRALNETGIGSKQGHPSLHAVSWIIRFKWKTGDGRLTEARCAVGQAHVPGGVAGRQRHSTR